jgi:phospholipid/cholesterol/gamma-HCH transport system permease protein
MVALRIGEITFGVFIASIPQFVKPYDVGAAMLKTVIFAVIIAIVGCSEGMYTEGGAAGVGRATTNSVVISMVLIFASNYFISAIMF